MNTPNPPSGTPRKSLKRNRGHKLPSTKNASKEKKRDAMDAAKTGNAMDATGALLGTGSATGAVLGAAEAASTKLRDNWQLLVAATLIVLFAVGFSVWRNERARVREDTAWAAFGKLNPQEATAADYEAFIEGNPGSSAVDIARLRTADALMATTTEADTTAAKAIYADVLKSTTSSLARELAKHGLSIVEARESFTPPVLETEEAEVAATPPVPTETPALEAAPEPPVVTPAPAPAPTDK